VFVISFSLAIMQTGIRWCYFVAPEPILSSCPNDKDSFFDQQGDNLMLLYNISIGMCLLSGSYFLLYKNGQSYRELAVLLLVCLVGIISGETWLVVSSMTSQIYIALLPVLFFSLLPLIYWYHKSLILDKAWCFSSSCFKHYKHQAIC